MSIASHLVVGNEFSFIPQPAPRMTPTSGFSETESPLTPALPSCEAAPIFQGHNEGLSAPSHFPWMCIPKDPSSHLLSAFPEYHCTCHCFRSHFHLCAASPRCPSPTPASLPSPLLPTSTCILEWPFYLMMCCLPAHMSADEPLENHTSALI